MFLIRTENQLSFYSIIGAIQSVLIILKGVGAIDVSWWVALIPAMLVLSYVAIFIALYLIIE